MNAIFYITGLFADMTGIIKPILFTHMTANGGIQNFKRRKVLLTRGELQLKERGVSGPSAQLR